MSAEHARVNPEESALPERLEVEEVDGILTPEERRALPWYYKVAYTPVPITTNRFVMLFWLVKQFYLGSWIALSKLGAYIKENPWKSVAGLAGGLVSTVLCKYFGCMVVAGLLIYALRKKSQ